jgi:putative hydrolase
MTDAAAGTGATAGCTERNAVYMWKLLYDHHTHTTFSHGKGSIEDNVKEAIAKGLQSVGITDHGPGHLTYGLKRENYPVMRAEVDRLNEKYPQIKVLLGVEANIWEPAPHIDVIEDDLQYLDYVIAGYHYGVHGGYTIHNYTYDHGLRFGGKSLLAKNTDMMVQAIYENDLYILTHPGDKAFIDEHAVAKACEETGTLVEINARHKHPNADDLRIYKQYDVRFVISSDAHRPKHVGRYAESLALAIEAGIDTDRIVNIEKR